MEATIAQQIPATAISEGAGVTVQRTIGTPALRHLDPFLMLDHFGSDSPDDYIAGFPNHPHRGFITLTYMIDGHMRHEDSMGNRGDLRSGGIQWMKAASGVIHSEMPQQTNGLMRGFQLWINLPSSQKMSDPAYQEFSAPQLPVVEEGGRRTVVIAGEYGGKKGLIDDPSTGVHYLDITLEGGSRFTYDLPPGLTAFAYLFEGKATLGEAAITPHHLVVMSPGGTLTLGAGGEGARFILVAGRPLGEPVVQYGPFVMNSQEEVEQAFQDYQQGQLVKKRAVVA